RVCSRCDARSTFNLPERPLRHTRRGLPRRSDFFFLNDPATPEIYTLSLHDALPICEHGGVILSLRQVGLGNAPQLARPHASCGRSEEHTSELQSPYDLVCRLLLEKKKKKNRIHTT